jgi:hypothetical protein
MDRISRGAVESEDILEGENMRWAAFAAGVLLAASPSVIADTGPTFPTDPPPVASGDGTAGSGGSTEPRKPRTTITGGVDIHPIPGGDPGAGR